MDRRLRRVYFTLEKNMQFIRCQILSAAIALVPTSILAYALNAQSVTLDLFVIFSVTATIATATIATATCFILTRKV